jgi:exodeoxyribonuclease VIII
MNVMLDLETMGSGSHAAIVAIGAVEFNPMAMTLGRKFYCLVDLESAVKEGGQMDAGTVIWWLRQGDAARQELAKGGAPMIQALRDFAFWLARSASDPIVWGNGSDFDNVILSSAYRRAGMPVPWRYSSSRCYPVRLRDRRSGAWDCTRYRRRVVQRNILPTPRDRHQHH